MLAVNLMAGCGMSIHLNLTGENMKQIIAIIMMLFSVTAIADQTTEVADALGGLVEPFEYKPWIGAGLIILDGYSTYYGMNHRHVKEVGNPMLGENPTNKQIYWMTGGDLILHYLFNQTKFKNGWNNYIITIKGLAVANNIYVINTSIPID